MNKTTCIGTLLLVASPAWCTDSGTKVDPVSLTPRLVPGETTYVEFTWIDDCLEKGPDRDPEGRRIKETKILGFKHEVLKILPSGEVQVRLTIDRAVFGVEVSDRRFHYDTDHPRDAHGLSSYGDIVQSLVGAELELTVRTNGEVVNVAGCARLASRARVPPTDRFALSPNGLYSPLSRPAMTDNWRHLYRCFAPNDVKPGDTWTSETQAIFGSPSCVWHYTFDRLEQKEGRRQAVVGCTMTRAEDDWVDTGSELMKSGPDTYTGHAVIDLELGRVVSSIVEGDERASVKKKDQSGGRAWFNDQVAHTTDSVLVQSWRERTAAKEALEAADQDPAGEVDLRPKWVMGDKTYLEFTWDCEVVEQGPRLPGRGERRHLIMILGLIREVREIQPNGDVGLELTVDRLALTIFTDDEELIYDTDNPATGRGLADYGKKLQSLVGHRGNTWIASTGEVLAIHHFDKAAEAIQPNANDPNFATMSWMPELVRPSRLIQNLRYHYGHFAFRKVRQQDEWKVTLTDHNGAVSYDVHYRLERIKREPDKSRAIVLCTVDQKRSEWLPVDDYLLTTGPNMEVSRVSIDLATGRVVSGRGEDRNRTDTKRLDKNNNIIGWGRMWGKTVHSVLVQTAAERQAAKAKPQNNAGQDVRTTRGEKP